MRHLILCEVLLAVPVAVPLDMPAPKPGGPVIKAPCVCGDACKCAAGTCPGKCPVARSTAKYCCNGNDLCKCEKPYPLNPNPGPCKCGETCQLYCFPIPAGAAGAPLPRVVEAVPPGYPPPPAGFRWERYPSGQWGLVQHGVRVPTQSSPAKATPVSYTPVGPVTCGPTG